MSSSLDRQVGGDHYKGLAIQPAEYIMLNRLSFLAGCIVKRITRYDKLTGKGLEDLEKIKHEVDLIIELGGWGKTGPQELRAEDKRVAREFMEKLHALRSTSSDEELEKIPDESGCSSGAGVRTSQRARG